VGQPRPARPSSSVRWPRGLVISGLLAGAPFIVLGADDAALPRSASRRGVQHRLLPDPPPCRGGVRPRPRLVRRRPPASAPTVRAPPPRGRLRGSRSAQPGGRSMKIHDA
jgi:hypothetical protein